METAALNGHLNIVELMLEKGADDFNEAMAMAAISGQVHIVRLMLDCGADDYNVQ